MSTRVTLAVVSFVKFKTTLARRFPPGRQKQILELCMDAPRLHATPVNEFVDLFVI